MGFNPISSEKCKRFNSLSGSEPSQLEYNLRCSVRREKNNGNDSYSSVESSDSNENQSKSLLELCILDGMHKNRDSRSKNKCLHTNVLTNNSSDATQSNPNLKQIDHVLGDKKRRNSNSTSSSHSVNRHLRERERKDKKLLRECINTGISKKISSEQLPSSSNIPKNVKSTSVAALESLQLPMVRGEVSYPSVPSTPAADVEKISTLNSREPELREDTIKDAVMAQKIVPDANPPSLGIDQMIMNGTGYDHETNSESSSNESFILDTTVSIQKSPLDVEPPSNKHKDPDLMLKSVERLTLEFVTSAENLRITQSSQPNSSCEQRKGSISLSTTNNTWNENTCPNDISFPSLSISPPKLDSNNIDNDEEDEDDDTQANHTELHDFAETPTNETKNAIFVDDAISTQPNSLETETDTLVASLPNTEQKSAQNGELQFQLGGEVTSLKVTPHYFSSVMTNSTIIAMEARTLALNLQHKNVSNSNYSLNSMELDHIGPPSGMDSFSGYYHNSAANSLQQNSSKIFCKSPKVPRKSIPAGIVARRALGQPLAVSSESVNSLSNVMLDNIKPPSLMDELLDSMMSVASIQSEIAEGQAGDDKSFSASISNYETAAGVPEIDENTVTLQSCCENLPLDEEQYTPLPSDNDFSSAESTPRKSHDSPLGFKNRTLTPKQKRKQAQERYKTYTIAADIMLNGEEEQNLQVWEADETLEIEINHDTTFEQGSLHYINCNPQSLISTEKCLSEEMSSIKALTHRLTYINAPFEEPTKSIESHHDDGKQLNSLEEDQNSETESNHDLNYEMSESPKIPRIIKNEAELKCNNGTTEVKTVRGGKKPAYVSPYAQTKMAKNKIITPVKISNSLKSKNTNVSPAKKSLSPSHNKKIEKIDEFTPQPALKREGTFVKDEPSLSTDQVPTVDPLSPTKNNPGHSNPSSTHSSPSHRASKLPTKLSPVTSKLKSVSASKKPTTPSSNIARKLPSPPKSAVSLSSNPSLYKSKAIQSNFPQRSNSNSAIRTTCTARIAVLSSRGSTTSPPSRSNSNLNGSALAKIQSTSKINQVQSRIAGIWKKIDEAHTKQTSTSSKKSSPKLQRSSTFDNTPCSSTTASKLKSKVGTKISYVRQTSTRK